MAAAAAAAAAGAAGGRGGGGGNSIAQLCQHAIAWMLRLADATPNSSIATPDARSHTVIVDQRAGMQMKFAKE